MLRRRSISDKILREELDVWVKQYLSHEEITENELKTLNEIEGI